MSWAATAKCHKLGGMDRGAVLSPSAGGWPAEIKVSVGWFPLRLCTEPFPASSCFWSLPAILGIIWGTWSLGAVVASPGHATSQEKSRPHGHP